MDEPFSALDPLIRRQLQDEFRELTKSLGKSAVFITHDLDEAIRIGDRIAIMKDGVIIQVGTAEEIILNPADPYVAEFVAGISRLHLIKAHSVMLPVAEFHAGHPGADLSALPTTNPEADIDELIDLALAHPGPGIAVLNGGGDPVGVVSWQSLLHGIKGSTTSEARA
jgi:glycine betaine/proline transport system ATP-binding protein